MSALTPAANALLFGGSLLGETIGSIIGGGSFIVQPVVLMAGFTMHQAIALDVTASCLTSVTGLATLKGAGRVPPVKQVIVPILCAIVGALVGPLIMLALPGRVLAYLFAGAAITVALLSLHGSRTANTRDHWNPLPVNLSSLVLGVYTGLSGAGSGIIAVALLTKAGLTPITAVALRKFLFIPATIVAALFYVFHRALPWQALIPMAAACAIAGWLGSRLILKVGDSIMFRVFRLATMALAVGAVWTILRG